MVALVSLLVIVTLSLIVTRVASVALVLTGMSKEAARFQARSAFTGCGFTTSEAEQVVNHPVRRRILALLMLLGSAGTVTAIGSLLLTFIDGGGSEAWGVRIVLLAAGLLVLWAAATSRWIDRRVSRAIGWALRRWTNLDVRDYADLLHLAGGFSVREVAVEADDWLASKTLAQLRLRDEGIMCLGIQRLDGPYLGAPHGGSRVNEGDVLLLYGRSDVLADLDERETGFAGWVRHRAAVREQRELLEQQARTDPAEP